VFTARYALSPYIKQARFVFKGLMFFLLDGGILPIPVAVSRSKASICSRSLAGIAGSNPSGHVDVSMSFVSVGCCQVEVSAWGWSLVRRSPTDCGVSECDREASIMRRPWPTRGCCATERSQWYYGLGISRNFKMRSQACVLLHKLFLCFIKPSRSLQ
jgi:hypothetical protein